MRTAPLLQVRRGLIPIALVLAGVVSEAAAQQSGPPDDSVARAPARVAHGAPAERPPTVDGKLDDPVWLTATPLTDFLQFEPFEGRPATERTEVRILYDAHALYVGAWLFDRDAAGIVQGEARRDVSLDDMDALLLVFDTYHDRQNAFVFGTTPAGIEYDGQVTREGEGGFTGTRQQAGSGGGLNLNWDGSWEVATSVGESGWFAEFRIPFATLRYGRSGPQTWGLNIARYVRRRNEQSFWMPIPRQYSLYRVSMAGTLQGIEAPAQRTMTVTPYVSSTAHRNFDTSTDTDVSADAGGDLKLGVTPSVTLDLTVNTDFAQVEVDEQQVNLTRFRLFFPEKRPFFLENAGTFSVGTPEAVELFFSRRIGIGGAGREVPIRGGGRVSGKAAGFTIGFLDIQTGSVDSVIADANYGAVRMVRELPNRSQIGTLFTTRVNTDSTGDYGLTYGVDGRLGIGDRLTFDGYAARTETPGLTGGEHAFGVSGSYTTRNWSVGATFREIGESFNPELGFLDRTAYRFVSFRILRHLRTPSVPWFREFRPHISYREHFDLNGFSETRLIHIDSHFAFENGSFFQLPAVNLTREGLKEPFEIAPGVVVPPGTYDNFEWGFAYNTNLSHPLSFEGRVTIGGFYTGHRKGALGTVNVRVGSTFIAGLRYSHDDVDLPQGAFETSLLGLRLSYAFTPRIYLQSLVQYNNQDDQFSGNFRLGWLGTAGTGLFVVYNEIQRTVSPTGPQDRALIVKFTRQFRFTR